MRSVGALTDQIPGQPEQGVCFVPPNIPLSATPVGLGEQLTIQVLKKSGTSVIVRSPAMVALYEELAQVARASISVLILGETGVGKDVVARSLHAMSPRRDRSFLRLNCATLTPSLIESELFGHERGAFTGAEVPGHRIEPWARYGEGSERARR